MPIIHSNDRYYIELPISGCSENLADEYGRILKDFVEAIQTVSGDETSGDTTVWSLTDMLISMLPSHEQFKSMFAHMEGEVAIVDKK